VRLTLFQQGNPPSETKTKSSDKMNYKICNSITGGTLIKSIELPETNVENLSSDSAEGHFSAGSLDELVAAGIDANQSVFALAA
jgi:hypothetical protein